MTADQEASVELDLDKIIDEQLLAWDFSIRVKGEPHRTRPLAIVDLAGLQKSVREADQSLDSLRGIVTGLFQHPRPNVGGWGTEQLLGAIKGYLTYWKANAEKNSGSISALVDAEMQRLLTPGSSTPPS